jgi:hypothetical protein
MVKFSIQAAHEQVNPLELLDDVIVMEKKEYKDVGQVITICLGGILALQDGQLGLGLVPL